MTTITDRVSASGHDMYDTSDTFFPGFSTTDTVNFGFGDSAVAGRRYALGLQWDAVALPDGATINAGCFIQLTDVEFGSGATAREMNVFFDESTSITAWSDGSYDPWTGVTLTTSSVVWNTTWATGATFNSPDIDTELQELVDDTAGEVTDVTAIVRSTDNDVVYIDIETYDGTVGEAPFINIEYTAAAGGDPEGPLVGGKLVGRGILGGRLVL